MEWSYQSAPWSSFIGESVFYLFPGLLTHAIFLVISMALIIPFDSSRFYPSKISTILIFNTAFMLFAMMSNGVWSCLVWGSSYYSTDYISDFSPFYPIRQGVIDSRFGDEIGSLNNISLASLNSTWFFYALLTWVMSFLATRMILSLKE